MCVIILRTAGTSIPFEKIRSACIVNPDGWGFAIADRGKLTVRKGLDKVTNPEEIQKILEDSKDQDLLLHLRYVTAGKRTIDNCHPFEVLNKKEHGVDIAFCHNGTLWTWKEPDSDYSDSWHVCTKLLKPLFQRVAAYAGPENALKDEFAIELMEQTAGTNSLFGLIDGNGLQLAINHDQGKEYEGWWASNDYSFNTRHREPTTTTSKTVTYPNYHDDDQYWEKWKKDKDQKEATKTIIGSPANACVKDPLPVEQDLSDEDEKDMQKMEDILEQGEQIKKVLTSMEGKNTRLNPALVKACLAKTRPKFIEVCKIDSLLEMTRFDPDDIEELTIFYPDAAAILIKDLLYELYMKEVRTRREAAQTSNAA